MKIKVILTIIACVLLSAASSSCKNTISLGTELNLVPPTVTIESPDFMENVSGILTIEGTSADKNEVASLSVTVENSSDTGSWKQEWRGDRGSWRYRNSADSGWETAQGNWILEDGKGNIRWSIQMSMEDAPNGEYLISVEAENSVRKTGVLQQRRVVIDTAAPVVSVVNPVMEFNDYGTGEQYTFADDVQPAFDKYELRDSRILDRLHNKRIGIQYEVDDDFSVKEIVFQLADQAGTVYYNRDKTPVQNAGWSGKTEILAKDIIDENEQAVTERTYLQLISTVTDNAGNSVSRSHGWLVWLPDADKPWVSGIGHDSDPQQFKVYPGSEMQGQAYDNDGVHSVSYRIYRKGNDQFVIDEGVFINEPLEEGAVPSMFCNWTVQSPGDCDEYRLVIDCRDINGTSGITEERYFYVYDIFAPSITLDTPSLHETLFGDDTGTFTVSGSAGDGVNPARLTLVWFAAGADFKNRILYQSGDYEGWDLSGKPQAGVDSNGAAYWKDSKGSHIWELELGAGEWDDTAKRMNKPFSKNINLFSDLGIGADSDAFLTAQTFVLRVEGATGRSLTELYSVRGDIQAPSLSIAKIAVHRDGSPVKEYPAEDLQSGSKMDMLKEGDFIYVSGNWGDDSFEQWKQPDKMGRLAVTWNGTTMPVAPLDAGTWEAGPLLVDSSQTGRGAGRIEASLQDPGNNKTISSFSAVVDTAIPYLMFISSDENDGAYNAGKEIKIYLEFNKDVTPPGGSITLTLNNEKTASYDASANSGRRHIFSYTIAAGDDTDLLNVNSIDYTGEWSGSGGPANMDFTGSTNLAASKKMRIDTIAPSVTKVEALSGSKTEPNYYRAEASLYLLLTFDEDITLAAGSGNVSLSLNSGGTASAPALSGQRSLLFTYHAAGGENTPVSDFLAAGDLTDTTGRLTDLAGNSIGGTSIPPGANIEDNGKRIVIDTEVPPAPLLNATGGTFTIGQSFTISGGESGATLEYQGRDSGSWLPYPSAGVTLSSAGTYQISARQTDRAGNVSPEAGPVEITIELSGELFTGFGGTPPGTYGTDSVIEVQLNFRESINVVNGSPTLLLNVTPPKEAVFVPARSETSSLQFTYTVQDGDGVDVLEIKEIKLNGASLQKPDGTELITGELPLTGWDAPGVMGLSYYTRIKISTDVPEFNSADFDAANQQLTLNFSKPVYKGSGSITLVQQGEYLAPAVLTKDEYGRLGSSAGVYYKVGTNGYNNTGTALTADLSEKYILEYNRNTNDDDVVNFMKAKDADKLIVPVVSGAVSIGADGKSLVIDLSDTWGYVFKVKGANYALTYNGGLVLDEQGLTVAAKTGNGTRFNVPGVNNPFIRVQKEKGKVEDGYTTIGHDVEKVVYWITGANISTTEQTGENWIKVPSFRFDPTVVYISEGQGLINIPDANLYVQDSPVDGKYTSPALIISYWQPDPPWTDYKNKPFWVNPFECNIMILEEIGDLYWMYPEISAFWIDTSTGTKDYSTDSPGIGWFGVTQTVTVTEDVPAAVAVQPLNAAFKIDCQTPGANIKYGIEKTATTPVSDFPDPNGPPVPVPEIPASAETPYTRNAAIDILSDTEEKTIENGYLGTILAEASLNAYTANAYETAARSVVRFVSPPAFHTEDGRLTQLWIRGGDSTSGGTLTPGFPLSWDEQDIAGIQLMTKYDDVDTWYWISWEINTAAYFHFIEGTTTTAEEAEKGPWDWAWSKNSWSFFKQYYPLHPGGSVELETGGDGSGNDIPGLPVGTYQFPENGFTRSR